MAFLLRFNRSAAALVLAMAVGLGLMSCTSSGDTAALPQDTAFLGNNEEETYSEILRAKQRVILQIELVDTVRPPQRLALGGARGYLVPSGNRRVQFRVLLPPASFTDSRAREARGYFDVVLVAGHRYQVSGRYEGNIRTFCLLDLTTGEPASPYVDLGFFGPVRLEMQYLPIIISR